MLFNLSQHSLTSHVNSSNLQLIASFLGGGYNNAEKKHYFLLLSNSTKLG